jgi:SAM-dependent methyltransferase
MTPATDTATPLTTDASIPASPERDREDVVSRAAPSGRRVLDVGCATGALGAAMLAAGATEVVGIELDVPAASIARGRLTAVYGYDLDGLPDLPYPAGYFDVLTLSHVLNQLPDPLASLRHLRRWLADEGRIVCSLPNVRHESILLPLLVEGRWDEAGPGLPDRRHRRHFTLESMTTLLRQAGFEPEVRVDGVHSSPSLRIELAAELVAALGGDPVRFRREAQAVQVILSARPATSLGSRAEPILDPWRGSRPVRVLVAPDLADPADLWARALAEVVDGLGPCDNVTVGVALPLPLLDPLPAGLLPLAERSRVDLLLTEAPGDEAGWERMLAGASTWIATSDHAPLRRLAARVGVDVQDLVAGRSAGAPQAGRAATPGT